MLNLGSFLLSHFAQVLEEDKDHIFSSKIDNLEVQRNFSADYFNFPILKYERLIKQEVKSGRLKLTSAYRVCFTFINYFDFAVWKEKVDFIFFQSIGVLTQVWIARENSY